ncbi:MAG: alcohol dehydrogenase catalytic domain-containing protein [Actinomycetes bacterium]
MDALTLDGPGVVTFRTDVPDPVVQGPGDAVVAVTAAGLCGSDLHPYEGREASRPGVVPGHEAVGEVVATGDGVTSVRVGDRVVVPFTTSCGTCRACVRGVTARCRRSLLLGWGSPDDASRVVHGTQAGLVRVPDADGTLVPLTATVDDRLGVLLADNLPTGAEAVERARVTAGDVLVVVGCGAVGLCAVAMARAGGVRTVVAVDPVPGRRERAASLGALPAAPDDAPAVVADASDGEGAAGAVEAAGPPPAARLAASLLRPGGVLSTIAVQTSDRFPLTPVDAYDGNLTLAYGRASARARIPGLLDDLAAGRLTLDVDLLVTHDVSLSEGPALYRRSAEREPGLVKAVLRP